MKAIRLSFFQMAAAMRRDMMLFASCFAPILAGFFFRFAIPLLETALTDVFHMMAVISPYYKLVDILFAMLPSTMFCFVSAMVSLEEKDEKTAVYLFITPLGKTGYILARFGVPSVIAFLATLILLPVFKLTAISPPTILLLAAGGTLQGMIVALLVLTISSNRLEGMAVTKLSTLTILGAVIPFFIKSDIQYIISLLPSFWIGKAILENMPLYMLPAFVLSAVWICFLLKRYLRKV
ncbi:ABC transporter permease [Lachnospiraceae bacterium]|jgi:fluoroquinolone transport system permease protein|nr:ABC transporter permease [uncultured Schaedlerella sp.]MCI9154138.1 ABC transporter permease [Ruminococcus sp.]NBI60112.1 ABC transporter permease [Lachnospiraceae bacterium]